MSRMSFGESVETEKLKNFKFVFFIFPESVCCVKLADEYSN